MQTEPSPEQSHADAGDGVERSVTQARAGVRKGMAKVLAISTFLAVLAIGAIWLVSARLAPHAPPLSSTQTAAVESEPRPNMLNSRTWDRAHLGDAGLEKCRAFRRVLNRVTELQGAGGGVVPPSERHRLDGELNTVKAMPPASLTPSQCGVPLG